MITCCILNTGILRIKLSHSKTKANIFFATFTIELLQFRKVDARDNKHLGLVEAFIQFFW